MLGILGTIEERPQYATLRALEDTAVYRMTIHELMESAGGDDLPAALVLTGLNRRAVGEPGKLTVDPTWGSLLWHTRPGMMSAVAAFSDRDRKLARQLGRPLITISHTALSPTAAASLVFPVGVRTLMLAAGLKGLLALDRKRKGTPLLLGRAAAARVVYPGGAVEAVEHAGATLPREVFDRAAFNVDQALGQVERKARRFLKDVVNTAITGRPPGR